MSILPVRAACLSALLLCAGLIAQQKNQDATTRNLEGIVTDAAGRPAAKAVVQLKNTKSLQIRSFIAADDGRYHFAGLGLDVDYQVKAEREGAASSWKMLSVFNNKKNVVINLKLNK